MVPRHSFKFWKALRHLFYFHLAFFFVATLALQGLPDWSVSISGESLNETIYDIDQNVLKLPVYDISHRKKAGRRMKEQSGPFSLRECSCSWNVERALFTWTWRAHNCGRKLNFVCGKNPCTYRDGIKGGPVLLSKTLARGGRNFSQPRVRIIFHLCMVLKFANLVLLIKNSYPVFKRSV